MGGLGGVGREKEKRDGCVRDGFGGDADGLGGDADDLGGDADDLGEDADDFRGTVDDFRGTADDFRGTVDDFRGTAAGRDVEGEDAGAARTELATVIPREGGRPALADRNGFSECSLFGTGGA